MPYGMIVFHHAVWHDRFRVGTPTALIHPKIRATQTSIEDTTLTPRLTLAVLQGLMRNRPKRLFYSAIVNVFGRIRVIRDCQVPSPRRRRARPPVPRAPVLTRPLKHFQSVAVTVVTGNLRIWYALVQGLFLPLFDTFSTYLF